MWSPFREFVLRLYSPVALRYNENITVAVHEPATWVFLHEVDLLFKFQRIVPVVVTFTEGDILAGEGDNTDLIDLEELAKLLAQYSELTEQGDGGNGGECDLEDAERRHWEAEGKILKEGKPEPPENHNPGKILPPFEPGAIIGGGIWV